MRIARVLGWTLLLGGLWIGGLWSGGPWSGPARSVSGAEDGPATAPAAPAPSTSMPPPAPRTWADVPLPAAAQKGVKWLVLSQNADGGWGPGIHAPAASPTSGAAGERSDLANTSLGALALLGTGSTPARGTFQGPLRRALAFVLEHVADAADRGLDRPTTPEGGGSSQIEGKIGRYAPALLATRLLVEVDGAMPDEGANRALRATLHKLVARVVRAQGEDGSWNVPGAWAPIHSTSIASQALWRARERGIPVSQGVFDRVERYTVAQVDNALAPPRRPPAPEKRKRPRRGAPVVTPGSEPTPSAGAAGVLLYSLGQGIEQLTRTPEQREAHAARIAKVVERLQGEDVLKGLGSMGGEEYLSYCGASLALARVPGPQAQAFHESMASRLTGLQDRGGSWSGHHCITGRTACTAMAVLTLVAERSVPRAD